MSGLPRKGQRLGEFSAESCPEREGDAVKRKRFSVEQIVAVLKQSRGRDAGGGSDPPRRDFGADLLPLEEAVRGAAD